MDALRRQKNWASYVPWAAIGCFLVVTVGMIICAAIAAVVVCMLMALFMVFMALGRTSLEKRVDEQGKVACGTWLWLAVLALLATVWWLILFWMVIVIFGSCVWYAAAFTVEGALANVIDIRGMANMTSLTTLTGSPANCPSACFSLAYFSHFITYVQDSCICSGSAIQSACISAAAASKALHLTIAGSFIMWAGSSFLLMVAVGAFATTRRERELMLRMQNNSIQAASSQMALGGIRMQENPTYYRDTQPLLAVQTRVAAGESSAPLPVPPPTARVS